jgi:hypothetical protein
MRGWEVTALFIILASFSSSQEWPMYQHDVMHSGAIEGRSNYSINSLVKVWSIKNPGRLQYGPVAADLNMDNRLELVYTTLDGHVYAIFLNGSIMWDYNVDNVISSPAAVGRFKDNTRFIVFVTANGRLYELNSTGEKIWSYNTSEEILSTPVSIGRFEGYDEQFILFDTKVVASNGSEIPYDKQNLRTNGFAEGYNTMADLRNTGFYISYIGSYPWVSSVGDVYGEGVSSIIKIMYDNSTGRMDQLQLNRETDQSVKIFRAKGISSPTILADLDGDRMKEVLYCDETGRLNILKPYSGQNSTYKVSDSRCISVIAADMNNDGVVEVITASSDGTIVMMTGSNNKERVIVSFNQGGIDLKGAVNNASTEEQRLDNDTSLTNPIDFNLFDFLLTNWLYILLFLFSAILVIIVSKSLKFVTSEQSQSFEERIKIGSDGGFLGWGGKGTDKSRQSTEPIGNYFKRGTDSSQSWGQFLSSEAHEMDASVLGGLMETVSIGPISFDDASDRLKVSKVKLAQHVTKLEEMGFIVSDSSRDQSNPILKPTGKPWRPT